MEKQTKVLNIIAIAFCIGFFGMVISLLKMRDSMQKQVIPIEATIPPTVKSVSTYMPNIGWDGSKIEGYLSTNQSRLSRCNMTMDALDEVFLRLEANPTIYMDEKYIDDANLAILDFKNRCTDLTFSNAPDPLTQYDAYLHKAEELFECSAENLLFGFHALDSDIFNLGIAYQDQAKTYLNMAEDQLIYYYSLVEEMIKE